MLHFALYVISWFLAYSDKWDFQSVFFVFSYCSKGCIIYFLPLLSFTSLPLPPPLLPSTSPSPIHFPLPCPLPSLTLPSHPPFSPSPSHFPFLHLSQNSSKHHVNFNIRDLLGLWFGVSVEKGDFTGADVLEHVCRLAPTPHRSPEGGCRCIRMSVYQHFNIILYSSIVVARGEAPNDEYQEVLIYKGTLFLLSENNRQYSQLFDKSSLTFCNL